MKKETLLLLTLALAVFAVITTELAIIGLLPQLARQLQVSPTEVGLLVSLYAVVVAVTGPFVTLLMSGWNKKRVLLSIMLIFVVSNLFNAYTDSYSTMLIFRVVPALVHAVFFAVALVVAVNSVSAEKSAGATAKVFAGVAVGLVLGVPLSAFMADHVSLAAAFLFGAVTSGLAFVGILLLMPSIPIQKKMSFKSQLKILKQGPVWLSLSTVVFVFATMFSGYSFIAEYLEGVTHMNGTWVSAMLMAFGVFGFFGNFLFSAWLQKNAIRTTLIYPLLYIGIYVLVYCLGGSFSAMVLLTLLWGLLHSAGLVISQSWLMRDASEAPEFANSLYISFSNLGITLGASLAGWVIASLGTHNLVWSSIIFAALALLSIVAKLSLYGKGQASSAPALAH
ncbi:arabinose ABC transporter permease [Pseudomonas brassicacearum]|uniref:MFS transporter n=1 Tax=Pseudomonas brassicacearum TaxID=930166 RepID=UPI00042E9CFC|nr:MFS transporter [Pseudomonas brassicacearum]AHL33500.1 arabinose ABC transporter permease [Pseudomonas brassicacearum]